MNKSILLATAVAASLTSSALSAGELSANVGMVSDYYYRGIQQSSSSANGGVDYDFGNGIAVGIWAADVGGTTVSSPTGGADGIEYDLYGSFSGEAGDLGYSVGATAYLYTGTFDTSYTEVNLGASYADFGVDVAVGTHEQTAPGVADDDYSFVFVSYATGPFSVGYGQFGGDWGGGYLELGLSTEIGGADAGVTLINGNPDDSFTGTGTNTDDGTALVFSISKSFEL